MPDQFHFLEPFWLLALLPLALLLWLHARHPGGALAWRKIVDPRLLPLLLQDHHVRGRRLPLWLLAGGWLLAVLALADPAWEKHPLPLLQTAAARVIVLDLSRSMLASDLQPSRLVRARFKIEDILAQDDEGRTGLVVFAGDAFSVTPLTRDIETIRAHLKALEPALMPTQGSRADLGLLKAEELLQQAGVAKARVLLIADGVEGELAAMAAARLRQSGYPVSVLGVGTIDGAPLPDGRGGTSRDSSGKPRLVKLDETALQAVAHSGGGRYSPMTGNAIDLNYLLENGETLPGHVQAQDESLQQWQERGPLLTVLLLPLAALAFRRGWMLGILFGAVLVTQPQPAAALGWNDLWLRSDQQAARAFEQQRYEQAAKLAVDPLRRGSAAYRSGNYQQAIEAYKQAQGGDAAYNRGNALAKLGQYRQALDAYNEALALHPDMEDALANKAAVEALLDDQASQDPPPSGQQGEPDPQDDSQGQQPGQGDTESTQESSPQGADNSTAGNPDTKQDPGQTENAEQMPANTEQAANATEEQDESGNAFSRANQALDANENEQEDGTDFTAAPMADDAPAREQEGEGDNEQTADTALAQAQAGALTSEEQLAAQQWLRRIEDDPGGLLRRKFLYQYRQRNAPPGGATGQDW